MISKTVCISQAFLCLIVIFHKALHLGDNICGRFNPVSINISHIYWTCNSTKSRLFCTTILKCAEKSDVSQQRHNAAHNPHNQIFLLSVFFESSLHQKQCCPQESFVFCKVLSLLSLQPGL